MRNKFGDCSISKGGGFRELKLLKTLKIKPGISKIDEPDNAGASLSTLWEFIEETIPEEYHEKTPIFMYATAGLRVLAEENSEKIYDDDDTDEYMILEEDDEDFNVGKVNKILNNLRNYVKNTSPFQLISNDHVRVLQGKEEGLFDFLTVQHIYRENPEAQLTGSNSNFTGKINENFKWVKENELYPVGTVDLGGASTQFSLVSSDISTYNISVFTPYPFLENLPSLYTHSFLDYGIHRAYELYQERLLNQSAHSIVHDPCLFADFRYEISKHGREYQIIGTAKAIDCKTIISTMFTSFFGNCKNPPCAMVDIQKPNSNNLQPVRFIAFDHAYRVASFFNIYGYSPTFFLSNRASKLLDLTLAELYEFYGEETNDELQRIIFEAFYVFTLLQNGYGLSHVAFADTLDGNSLSWAVGAMVFNANHLCEKNIL